MASRWLCADKRGALTRLCSWIPAVLAGIVATSGCGVVTSGGSGAGGPFDASTSDSADDSSLGADATSCRPGDVQTYVPGTYRHATAAWQRVCDVAQINAFYAACLGAGASKGACDALSNVDASDAACAACILTPDTADAYGPLVGHATFVTPNVAGCIELTDPTGLSCAKAQAALDGCALAACEANCPGAAFDGCASATASGGCQPYAAMAVCVAAIDAGPAAVCVAQSFQQFYDWVVPLFCGAPYPDGGVLPSDAASEGSHDTDGEADASGYSFDAGPFDGAAQDSPRDGAASD